MNAARAKLLLASAIPGARRAHGLRAPLIVSLTSYPPRFANLHWTLRSLLSQSVAPDAVQLWIAHDDMAKLPRRVRRMARAGLAIRACDDVRSYKKLIFALEEHPDAYIATADDDSYYPYRWLETLARSAERSPDVILCHRAARARLGPDGSFFPYRRWNDDIDDEASRSPSTDLVPIGVAGVLYPPGSLAPQVSDRSVFTALAPTADDLWFYWMARAVGTRHQKVGGRWPRISWPGAQRDSLWVTNAAGQNDLQIRRLVAALGQPRPGSERSN